MAVSDEDCQLPPDVEQQIEPNFKNDLRRKEVAEIFYEADRPYLGTSHVKQRVDGEYTRDTVSRRLNELVNAGVLRKDSTGNADQYWIANDDSYWMIPDDVVVMSDDNPEAITWSDLLNDKQARNFGLGLLLTAVGGIMITGFALLAGAFAPGGLIYNGLAVLMALALIGAFAGFVLCVLSVGKALISEEKSELSKILPL